MRLAIDGELKEAFSENMMRKRISKAQGNPHVPKHPRHHKKQPPREQTKIHLCGIGRGFDQILS